MLKDKVLKIFLQNENEIVTGGYIAKELNVTRNSIWKAVNTLKKSGYNIESIKNVGYKLIVDDNLIEEELIRKNLKTKFLGNKIQVFKTINSTNTYLKETEFESGTVIIANHQSKGKGRRGKTFVSNKDKGIYLSFIIDKTLDIEKVSIVTICVAVSVARALKKVCSIDVDLKWVNDIFYKNKKLGGILTEGILSIEDKNLTKLIVGIGLNTNAVTKDIEDIAISLEDIIKGKNYKNTLISEILNSFEEIFYKNLLEDNMEEILKEYKEKLFFIGSKIKVMAFDSYEAKALDINNKGELIVECDNGDLKVLSSGEISIKVGN